jgi:hypothetical protein
VIVWLLDLQLPMQSVPITTNVVGSNPAPIAYLLVAATYIFVGVMFYISFPMPKDCIEDVSK